MENPWELKGHGKSLGNKGRFINKQIFMKPEKIERFVLLYISIPFLFT